MADSASGFTAIERTIVDWLEASGFKVAHRECEWIAEEVEREMSITSLACAIHSALYPPPP